MISLLNCCGFFAMPEYQATLLKRITNEFGKKCGHQLHPILLFGTDL